MNLKKAATYFSKTPVSGWNGTSWVPEICNLTLLPHDRFISEREFGNKRRYVLTDPDDSGLDDYKVIRFDQTGVIYLVGVKNYDVLVAPYSQLYLLHAAPHIGNVIIYTSTTTASGMKTDPVRAVAGSYHCDVERVTFTRSGEFDTIKFSEMTLIFADGTPIDTDNEVQVGSDFYDVQEAYDSAGFRYCRALKKRSE